MTTTAANKRLLAAAGTIVVLLAAGTWWLSAREPRMPAAPLAMVPDGATAIAWAELDAVRGSPLWKQLVTERGGERGLARIEETCGFDPLAQIDDLVLFITGDSPQSLDHFGAVARGAMDREGLARCVGDVVGESGGEIERTEIDGVPALAGGRGDSRAAFVARDGLAVGNETTVRGVLGVLREQAPSAASDETLQRLWKRVAGGREVVVVAHVPARWRRALQRYVDERLGGTLGPLEALGIGARVSRGLGLGVALEMGAAADAEALVEALRATIDRTLDDPIVGLSAVGPALRDVKAVSKGSEATVTVDLRQDQVEELVDLVRTRLGRPQR